MCIAYSSDDTYAKYLGISMLSLFQANKAFAKIEVFILDCGIRKTNKEKLLFIAKEYKRDIYFMSMETAISSLELKMGAKRISVASYARLFLASIIPESYDRILYLDCDTIVRDYLAEFWSVDLDKYILAGVRDTVDKFFLKKIGMESDEYYVNAGVLLINLDNWRKENLERKFIEFIQKFNGKVPHHDQGTINGVCKKMKYIVDPRFNMTTNIYSFTTRTIERIYYIDHYYNQDELEYAKENPAILHFTTGLEGRPWEENCTHPMKNEYLRTAEASPWKYEPLLPDSRKLFVKIFSSVYKHTPLFLSETLYRIISRLTHIGE